MNDFVSRLTRNPSHFRSLAQEYAEQKSLFKRTIHAIEDTGRLPLNDSLGDSLFTATGRYDVTQQQERIVDLLIMAALGQHIEQDEINDHISFLATEYKKFALFDKLRESSVISALSNDPVFCELEQEWVQADDNQLARQFATKAKAEVERAAKECGVSLSSMPDL